MLAELLKKYKLKNHPIAGDGNCLFGSLALFFQDFNPVEMRQYCIGYIETHPDIFRADIEIEYGCSVEQYCKTMINPRVYGDAIALQAFTLAFPCTLWLFMPTGMTKFGEGPRNIALIRVGEHYNAAVPHQ